MSASTTGADVRAGDIGDDIDVVLCDLDGVVWLARTAIPGASDAVRRLRATGRRVLFVTNNSVSLVGEQEQALADIGIPATGDVVTSAQAAASLVEPGRGVLVCGGPGVAEAIVARGARVADDGPVDAVVVGLDRGFTFATLDRTSRAVRDGARFVATNDDPTFPTATGLTPGAGSIVAAIATASGRAPEIAGKPHRPMAALVAERCGPTFAPSRTLMVGDRWSTDGAFAETLGCPFALVRSGVTRPGAPTGADAGVDQVVDGVVGGVVGGGVDLDAADLAAVVDHLVGPRSGAG